MRSNIVEPYASPNIDIQGQRKQPQYEPPGPVPSSPTLQFTRGTSKFCLVLAPKEGWLAMLLLAAAVCCVVYSISSVGWVSHTFILYWSAIAGLFVGLAIAKIHRLPQPILHVAACLIGHWLSIWLTSAIAYRVFWGLLIAGIGAVLTDPSRVSNSEMVFLFYLSFLSFFLGYFGAWLIYHAHLPWLVALVYCSVLLINLNYVKQNISFVIAIMLAALILLIGRIQLATQLEDWKSQGLYIDRSWLRGITRRFIQIASALLLLALLSAWALPVLSEPSTGVTFWNNIDNAWANVTQGHLSLQNTGSILQPYQTPTNFFGDQLTIAGSVHLPAGEVLHYTSSNPAAQYLPGFSYDHFDGHTWTSSDLANGQNYDARASLPNDTSVSYTPVNTSITIVQPPGGKKHYLFGPSQPSTFDVATTLYGNPFVSAWSQQSPLSKGEHYQVTSFISTASPRDLSPVPFPQDNPDYWSGASNLTTLQLFYLQVPNGLSRQVLHTAEQWTQGATGMYDALKMLESHLSNQTQFTYALDNPPVPDNVDAISWLLKTRHGYCTYYATAMTIMARLLGIPTRVINGFSHGHLDSQRKVWVVDGSDAHSWVQAYFPGYGWINFDPTPGFALNSSQPVTQPAAKPTPSKPAPTATPAHKKKGTPLRPPSDPPTNGGSISSGAANRQNMLVELSLVALAGSILVLLVAIGRYWWRNLYAGSSFVAGAYWRVCRLAGMVGLSPRAWQTPYEFSQALCQRVPREARPLWRLTELFVRERWAPPHQAPQSVEERELQRSSPRIGRIFLQLLWHKARHRLT
ncbi:MAG: transglutaminase domain-containing protein [Chloroflexi bacterium]|nr:MAG: transglutaminase domain-containing protein [Chloroflexota bacterium]